MRSERRGRVRSVRSVRSERSGVGNGLREEKKARGEERTTHAQGAQHEARIVERVRSTARGEERTARKERSEYYTRAFSEPHLLALGVEEAGLRGHHAAQHYEERLERVRIPFHVVDGSVLGERDGEVLSGAVGAQEVEGRAAVVTLAGSVHGGVGEDNDVGSVGGPLRGELLGLVEGLASEGRLEVVGEAVHGHLGWLALLLGHKGGEAVGRSG